MARRDVGKIQQPRFTPQAAPVSTYHRTAEGDTLRQLADSLAGFAPQVAAFATTLHEKKKTEDFERGQFETNKSIAENIEEVRKQIAEGTLGASESKWYRLGATEAYGKAFGRKYASDWANFVATDPVLSKSTDMKVYDEEERKFRKEWYADPTRGPGTAESNLAIEKGFQPTADNAVAGQRFNYAQAAASRLEGAVNELHFQEIQQIYDMALPDATIPQIGKAMGYLVRTQYILNPKAGELINRTTIQAVADLAILHGDPEILDILMEIPGGPKGSLLGKTTAAREAVEKAKDEIARNFMRDNAVSSAREAKRQEMIGQTAYVTLQQRLADAIAEGGQAGLENYDLQKDINELVAAGGTPQQQKMLEGVYAASRDRVTEDDADVRHHLFLSAFKGQISADDIAAKFAGRAITVETAMQLTRLLEDIQGHGEVRSLAANRQLAGHIIQVQKAIVDNFAGNAEDINNRDREARVDMTMAFYAWAQTDEGKEAIEMKDGGVALEEFLVKIGDATLGRLVEGFEENQAELGPGKAPRTVSGTAQRAEAGWLTKRTVTEANLAQLDSVLSKLQKGTLEASDIPVELGKLLYAQNPPVEVSAFAIRRFVNQQRKFQ